MTSIIGYADMLRSMQVDPAEQKEAAAAIFHEAKRLESLSQKLLQLMRLSEEPLAPRPPTALAAVVAEVARSTLPACRQVRRAAAPAHHPPGGDWLTPTCCATFCATWSPTPPRPAGPARRCGCSAAVRRTAACWPASPTPAAGIPPAGRRPRGGTLLHGGQIPRPQKRRQRPRPGAVPAHCPGPRQPAAHPQPRWARARW